MVSFGIALERSQRSAPPPAYLGFDPDRARASDRPSELLAAIPNLRPECNRTLPRFVSAEYFGMKETKWLTATAVVAQYSKL
jgi:hypothetical protein